MDTFDRPNIKIDFFAVWIPLRYISNYYTASHNFVITITHVLKSN